MKTVKYRKKQSVQMRKLIAAFNEKGVAHLDVGCEILDLIPIEENIFRFFNEISLDPDYHLYAYTSYNSPASLFLVKKGESIPDRPRNMDIMPFVNVPFTAEALWEAFLLWDCRGIFLPRHWHANYGRMLLLTDKIDFNRKFEGYSFRSICEGDLDKVDFDFTPYIVMNEEEKTAEITFYHWSLWGHSCMRSGAQIKWCDNRVEIRPTMYPDPNYTLTPDDEDYEELDAFSDREDVDLGVPFAFICITY